MNIRSALKHAAMGVPATVLAFGIAANANAQSLEAGKCYPKAMVTTAIANDAMEPIAIGNRVDGVGNANIYFANSRGYGYGVESDRPYGTPASQEICVLYTYNNVRINASQKAIPSWLNIKDGDGKTYSKISAAIKAGDKIVFTASAYSKDTNGHEVPGKTLAIFSGNDRIASVTGVNSQGYSTAAYFMRDFALTTNANKYVVAQNSNAQEAITIASNMPAPGR